MNDKMLTLENNKQDRITELITNGKIAKFLSKFSIFTDHQAFVLQCLSDSHALEVTAALFTLQNTLASHRYHRYVIIYTNNYLTDFNSEIIKFLKTFNSGKYKLDQLQDPKKEIDAIISSLKNRQQQEQHSLDIIQNAIATNVNNNNVNSNDSTVVTHKNGIPSSTTIMQQQPLDRNTQQNTNCDDMIQANSTIDNLQQLLLTFSVKIKEIYEFIDLGIKSDQHKAVCLDQAKNSLQELSDKLIPYTVNHLSQKTTFEEDTIKTVNNLDSTSIETIYIKCEWLKSNIFSLFNPHAKTEAKNNTITGIKKTIQWLRTIIVQLSITTAQETTVNENDKNNSINSTAGFFQKTFQKKIQQKPENDLNLTTQTLHDLIRYFVIPSPSVKIQSSVLCINQMYIRQHLLEGIKSALSSRSMTFIPIQEYHPKNEHVSYFVGSLIAIKPQENFIEIKYINPLGSCLYNYSHLNHNHADAEHNISVYTKYLHTEKDYILENIQDGILNNSLANTGILLTNNAQAFLNLMSNDWLISLPKCKINLVFTGLVQLNDQLQNCGVYLICNLFQEIYNKPLCSDWDIDKVKSLFYQELPFVTESQNNNTTQSPIILD